MYLLLPWTEPITNEFKRLQLRPMVAFCSICIAEVRVRFVRPLPGNVWMVTGTTPLQNAFHSCASFFKYSRVFDSRCNPYNRYFVRSSPRRIPPTQSLARIVFTTIIAEPSLLSVSTCVGERITLYFLGFVLKAINCWNCCQLLHQNTWICSSYTPDKLC